MSAFLARLVLAISLLFGSVVVPAVGGAEAGHAMEVVDLDCEVLAVAADVDDKSSDNAPPLHIDHHHCSACTELNGRSSAADMLALKDLLFGRPVAELASYATPPPIQPPAA